MTDRVAEGQVLGARQTQEDAIRVVGERGRDSDGDLLLILADGMGGHAGGEVASALAVETFAHHFSAVSGNLRPRGRLSEAMEAANAAIAARIAEAPELRGMGCTLIGALVAGGRLVWVSVGDSILYLLRDGRLRRLNADHSVFGELMEHVERGEMTRAEAEAHPRRNALRAALTGESVALVDLDAIEVDPGDVVILASDGLETLTAAEIERLAQEARGDGPDAVRAALLDAVVARGRPKQDNTSVVVLAIDRTTSSIVGWPRRRGLGTALQSLHSQVAVGVTAAVVIGLTAFLLTSDGQGDEPAAPDPASADAGAGGESVGGGSSTIDEAPASGDREVVRGEDDGATEQSEIDETETARPETTTERDDGTTTAQQPEEVTPDETTSVEDTDTTATEEETATGNEGGSGTDTAAPEDQQTGQTGSTTEPSDDIVDEDR